jgi:ADP-ribose pyrophosphatase
MEQFAKPGVGGIIEKNIDGIDCILVQDRCKENAKLEFGLLEIPAGKIREFENIFDCLRREIWEETGLKVTHIKGEDEAIVLESNGYKVLNYTPFSCSQNIQGTYPIMVQAFICNAVGELLKTSNEAKNIRWMPILELKKLLENNKSSFYPMHVITLEKYLKMKLEYDA